MNHPTRLIALLLMALQLISSAPSAALQAAPQPPAGGVVTDKDYLLEAGDELAVDVSPRAEYSSQAAVQPDGVLRLKGVDPFIARGLTVDQVHIKIIESLKKILKAPRVSLRIVRLANPPIRRTEKITITGAVSRAGVVDLEPGLRLRKAIDLVGGFAPDADLEHVIVIRPDLSRRIINLKAPGAITDTSRNLELQDGDSVEVPSLKKVYFITGAVQKSGVNEFQEEIRLDRAVQLAQPLETADLSRIAIKHKDNTQQTFNLKHFRAEDLLNTAKNPVLRDGDTIVLDLEYQPGFVTISGAVERPATYPVKGRMTIQDLIIAAGKLQIMANIEEIELHREGKAQKINLVQEHDQGRLGDLVLLPGDHVNVPRYPNKIFLIAPVQNPGDRPLREPMTVLNFLIQGRGDNAALLNNSSNELKKIEIIRPGEKKPFKFDLKKALLNPMEKSNIVLQNGDSIWIESREQRLDKTQGLLSAIPWVGTLAQLFLF